MAARGLWLGVALLLALEPGTGLTAPPVAEAAGSPCATRPEASIRAAGTPPAPISFYAFPRPPRDTGRGVHWIPTTSQPPEVVNRYLSEARAMSMSWITFLNDGTTIGPNDHLVRRAVAARIEPIMRIYTPHGRPIEGDLGALVSHYRALGVRYFQLYNEPNLAAENVDGQPNVKRYVEQWATAARSVLLAGGYPGIGALSPGGDYDDRRFLEEMLIELDERGERHLLDCAWLAVHNYAFNRPINYVGDTHSFLGFRLYHEIIARRLQRPLPMLGTEGGAQIGVAFDPAYPPVTPDRQVALVMDGFDYMVRRDREPFFFVTSYWVIANEVAGAITLDWSSQALFRTDATSPIVYKLKQQAAAAAAAKAAPKPAAAGRPAAAATRPPPAVPQPTRLPPGPGPASAPAAPASAPEAARAAAESSPGRLRLASLSQWHAVAD